MGKGKSTIAVLLAFASFPFAAFGQVQLELNVLEEGERPRRDTVVWVIPSSGTPEDNFTDHDGYVRFSIAPTAYVTVWLDTPDAPTIPRMSGRFSQKTSVYLGGLRHGTQTKYGTPIYQKEHIEGLLDALEERYQGAPLPDGVKDMLRRGRIRERAMETNALPGLESDADDQKAGQRNQLVDRIDQLLRPAPDWYLGVTARYMSHGAYVRSVKDGTPARIAGIQTGDWLTHVDGTRVGFVDGKLHSLPSLFARSETGHVVIHVLRPTGQVYSRETVDVQLQKR